MTLKNSWIHGFSVLLGGMVLFSACPADSTTTVITEWLSGGGGGGLTLNSSTGDWEDVDVVSGASLLRLDNRTFVYADNGGSTLKKVDVLNPTVAVSSTEVGYPAAVIQVSGDGKKIAAITGTIPSGELRGMRVKAYDSDLKLLMDAPFGDWTEAGDNDFGSLYSEIVGSTLAVGDKYAVIIWTDNTDTWPTAPSRGGSTPGTAEATYVGIYQIATGKAAHFKMSTKGESAGTTAGGDEYFNTAAPDDNVLAQSGIGTPGSLATYGDYVLVGSNNATAAFKINADLTLTNVTPGTVENSTANENDGRLSHWMVDNGVYAVDCGNMELKVWKWNGTSAPTETVIDDLGSGAAGNRGYVRVLCYDQDDPSKMYVYMKNSPAAASGGLFVKPNGVYSIDLAAGTKEFLFMPVFSIDDDEPYHLSGWGLERFKKGTDEWFVVAGASVEIFKNPRNIADAATADNITITPDWHKAFDVSVHIAKAFNADGRYFVAIKSGAPEEFPPESILVLHEIK